MKKIAALPLVVAIVLAGCSKPPTAMEACKKLEAEKLASNCKPHKPGGLASDASDGVEFDLPSVPGHTGAIWAFDNDKAFESTVTSYDNAKVLAGPHRYGSKSKRLFAQINEGLSMEDGRKVKEMFNGF